MIRYTDQLRASTFGCLILGGVMMSVQKAIWNGIWNLQENYEVLMAVRL